MILDSVLTDIPDGFNKVLIESKACYNNAFNFANINRKAFKEKKMKIAYGFVNNMSLSSNLWIRHCFLLDSNNNVLDVTLLDNNMGKRRYIVFKTFDSSDELLGIKAFMNDTSLSRYLIEYEKNELLKYVDDNFKSILNKVKYGLDVVIINI